VLEDFVAEAEINTIWHSADIGKTLEYNETVLLLFVDFKNAYDSVRREVLYCTIFLHENSRVH
jgi:hypothetical protein